MKGRDKRIKFTYYEVIASENDEEVLYDLKLWLNGISQKSIEERIKTVGGVRGRLESVEKIGTDCYAFNFMRLDEASDSYKVKEAERAEHIDLEDDEYLGRNTVALYDSVKHVILIQNNRGSYSANAIQNYVNATDDGTICYFRPMIDNFDVRRCKKGVIKKICARCSAADQFDADGSKAFEQIIDSCNELGGYTFYVEIGIGRGKDKKLNNKKAYEAVNTLLRNRSTLAKAQIALSDEESDAVYNLFDNLKTGEIVMRIPPRGELPYIDIARRMYGIYING